MIGMQQVKTSEVFQSEWKNSCDQLIWIGYTLIQRGYKKMT